LGPSHSDQAPFWQTCFPDPQLVKQVSAMTGTVHPLHFPSRQLCSPVPQVFEHDRLVTGTEHPLHFPSRQVCSPGPHSSEQSRRVTGTTHACHWPSRQICSPSPHVLLQAFTRPMVSHGPDKAFIGIMSVRPPPHPLASWSATAPRNTLNSFSLLSQVTRRE
jgi:hypothetical protein